MKLSGTRFALVYAVACGLFAGLATTGYSALVLAEFGVFNAAVCGCAGLVAFMATVWFVLRLNKEFTREAMLGWIAAGALSVGSLWLTTPPSEMILGGWDPGVYVHTAAAIADGGSLQIDASDVASLSAEDRKSLVMSTGGDQLFPGMFLLPNGRLSPQFMHLYPSLMALFYAVAGVWGALLLNPLLNCLAILLMYGLASRIVGIRWGLAAAVLLAVNPAQVWQAKFCTAEMLAQVLLLAGFAALIDFSSKPGRLFKPVLAGTMFGLALLTKYEVVMVVVPLVLLLVVLQGFREHRRNVFVFSAVLGLFALHMLFHMRLVAPCYRPLSAIVFPVVTGSLAVALAFAVLGRIRAVRELVVFLTGRTVLWKTVFTCAFAAFVLFAWYVRPRFTVDGRIAHLAGACLNAIDQPEWMKVLGGPNAFNMYYLKAIFGPVGVILGCAGVMLLVWRSPGTGVGIWLTVSVLVTMILVTDVFHDHFMMWVSRRFIPVVVPLLSIGIAAAANEICRQAARMWKPAAVPVAIALLIVAIAGLSSRSLYIGSTRDWPGLCAWYGAIAKAIPRDAVVFCDQWGFAAPLRFIYGIKAYEVYGGKTCSDFLESRRQAGTAFEAFVLTMRQQPAFAGMSMSKVAGLDLSSHILEQPKYEVPGKLKGRGGHFELYQVVIAKTSSPENP